MESRKMAFWNIFPGKEWRRRCSEWICGHSRVRGGWDELRKYHLHIHTACVHAKSLSRV